MSTQPEQKNLALFKYSQDHPDKLIDEAYTEGQLVITKNKEEKNKLMKNSEKLNDLIAQYANSKSESEKNRLVETITDLLCKTSKEMNLTPFSQYLQVLDTSYTSLKESTPEEKQEIIRQGLNAYIKDRLPVYSSHGYSHIVLQVISDTHSHKRHGASGTNKVKKQMDNLKIPQFELGTDPNGNYYLLVDKNTKEYDEILEAKGITVKWSEDKQGKRPDILINYDGKLYIIEHKHMKESGGGQDKQGTEVTDFIRQPGKGVSYVTYLDGHYWNKLISNEGHDKATTLKNNIIDALTSNANNYFLNTAGFERFIEEVVMKLPNPITKD